MQRREILRNTRGRSVARIAAATYFIRCPRRVLGAMGVLDLSLAANPSAGHDPMRVLGDRVHAFRADEALTPRHASRFLRRAPVR